MCHSSRQCAIRKAFFLHNTDLRNLPVSFTFHTILILKTDPCNAYMGIHPHRMMTSLDVWFIRYLSVLLVIEFISDFLPNVYITTRSLRIRDFIFSLSNINIILIQYKKRKSLLSYYLICFSRSWSPISLTAIMISAWNYNSEKNRNNIKTFAFVFH